MAQWCLSDVDYEALDFLNKPSLESKFPPKEAAKSSHNSTSSTPEQNTKYEFTLSTSSPKSCVETVDKQKARDKCQMNTRSDVTVITDSSSGPHWCQTQLREVLFDKHRHGEIALCIATWPLESLRLQDVLLPEECDKLFVRPDQLWTCVFQGLLLLSPISRLTRLDLTGYVPSRGLLYTVLQLLPLLTLSPDNLDQRVILEQITKHTKLKDYHDEGLMQNMTKFVCIQLDHKVFKSGRRIHLPVGRLDVMLDFLTISSAGMFLLGLLMSRGLEQHTHVHIIPNTIVFRYSVFNNRDLDYVDPLLALTLLLDVVPNEGVTGIVFECIPENAMDNVLTLLCEQKHKLKDIEKFGITHSSLDLTRTETRTLFGDLINCMTQLKRLDLTGAKIGGALETLVNGSKTHLEYLNLSHCCLEITDLDSLTLCSNIRDLDMSYVYNNGCPDCVYIYDDAAKAISLMNAINRNGSEKDSGYNSQSQTSSTVNSPRPQKLDLSMVSLAIGQRSTADVEPKSKHEADCALFRRLVKLLPVFPRLSVVELSTTCFQDETVNDELLSDVRLSIQQLKELKYFSLKGIPLWDEDIFDLLQVFAAMSHIQRLHITRSDRAPCMDQSDKVRFWTRVEEILQDKRLKMGIEMADQSTFDVDSEEDD